MSYLSLARKYRPSCFSDLVEQEAVSRSLRNAIAMDKAPRCVLFSGIRGVGKTTAARLYAKALNCEGSQAGEACAQCTSCQAIKAGTHQDVLEIDGASHNGVDEIRSLRESLGYVAQRSRYRVFIIDEVHMLSMSAFNALLKVLEETPTHVFFIFATTEKQKVPKTVLSRCQSFLLQKISLKALVARLELVLQKEKIDFEADALVLIAKQGRGSMRDALTLLDQVIAFADGKVSLTALRHLMPALNVETYFEFLFGLVEKKPKIFLQIARRLQEEGLDFSDFIEEAATYCRHAFVVRDLGVQSLAEGQFALDESTLKSLSELAQKASDLELNRIFRVLTECLKDFDGSELDRYIFENICFEWCFDPGLPNIEDLKSFLAKDRQVAQLPREKKNSNSSFSEDLRAKKSFDLPKETLRKKIFSPEPRQELREEVKQEPKPQSLTGPKLEQEGTKNSFSPAPCVGSMEVLFPKTWSEFVQRFKKIKPLEARILEETYPLKYSPEEILLAVKQAGVASSILLKENERQRLQEKFTKLIGFNGKLNILLREEEKESLSQLKEQSVQAGKGSLPESLLEKKEREALLVKEQIIAKATQHSLTKALSEELGLEISQKDSFFH